MARTNESYLRWKFGHWVAEGYALNVTLVLPGERPSATLGAGETAIARIGLEAESSAILLTDRRLLRGDETLVRFDEVESCIWIDRDDVVAARLKRSKFDRVILDLYDGREVVIDGLGQAVFPLLNFWRLYTWVISHLGRT